MPDLSYEVRPVNDGTWRVYRHGKPIKTDHRCRIAAHRALVALFRADGWLNDEREHDGWDMLGELIESIHE